MYNKYINIALNLGKNKVQSDFYVFYSTWKTEKNVVKYYTIGGIKKCQKIIVST